MKFSVSLLSYYFTPVVLLLALSGKCEFPKQNGDYQFEQFLKDSMSNYSSWLKNNGLDPSPPSAIISKIKSSQHDRLILLCNLSNHHAVGHSNPQGNSGFSSSCFDSQFFRIGRTSDNPFQLYDDFNCTGVTRADNFSELENDLPFSGKGKFEIDINGFNEVLTMRNVIITKKCTLDMTYSSAFYRLNPDLNQFTARMKGTWNETLITGKYLGEVQTQFRKSFWIFAAWRFGNDLGTSFPTGQLLEGYAGYI